MGSMRNFKLTVSYDGTNYCGWQIQPNGISIQQKLTDAIEEVTGAPTKPVASGRTDSGVHAVGQIASVRTETTLTPATFQRAVNAHLPADIVIRETSEVDIDFDPVRHAKWKLYRYVFHDGGTADPFLRNYAWHVFRPLDLSRMTQAAEVFLGTHDFRCFESQWPNRASSIRTIRRCEPIRLGDMIYLDVEANGFLYNMVRAIAGTLYEIGRDKWPVEKAAEILRNGKRAEAGPNAPASGLYLMRVEY